MFLGIVTRVQIRDRIQRSVAGTRHDWQIWGTFLTGENWPPSSLPRVKFWLWSVSSTWLCSPLGSELEGAEDALSASTYLVLGLTAGWSEERFGSSLSGGRWLINPAAKGPLGSFSAAVCAVCN